MFLEEVVYVLEAFKQACSKLYNNVKPGEVKKKILHQSKLSELLDSESDISLPK